MRRFTRRWEFPRMRASSAKVGRCSSPRTAKVSRWTRCWREVAVQSGLRTGRLTFENETAGPPADACMTTNPSRRHVLRSSLAAAIAAGVAPLIRVSGKEIDMDDVMGSGRHVYELDRDWPKLPASMKLGYTHGIAIDSQNRVIIFNQSAD